MISALSRVLPTSLLAVLLATAGLLVPSPPVAANPAGTGLVISEVFGGGGNSGAPLRSDFIELYNPTAQSIPLDGLSLQYRSVGGGSGGTFALSGSVPARTSYLVKAADGGNTAQPALPTPDATTTLSMSATNGQVLLVRGTSAFIGSGDVAGHPAIVDAVGYGTTPTTFETAPTGRALSNTTAATRDAAGTDRDQNAADFTSGAPTPVACGAPCTTGGGGPAEPRTIAEIQGTGASSPMAGDTVVTEGVVTGVYGDDALNGLFIQSGGTGGATDATPGASDGIFVFGRDLDESGFALGDSVEVTGVVGESFGQTQITPAPGGVVALADPLAPVTPLATAYPRETAEREAHEGELLAPSGPFTVTNVFGTNRFAEIGLAAGTTPLIQPTEVQDAQTGDPGAVAADNAARAVVLDDGANVDYTSGANRDVPLPWLTRDRSIRVGAPATFTGPVVLSFGFGAWRFQPQQRVTGTGEDVLSVADTRTPAPEEVGGDLRLATFNVLNYFPTTGEEYAASGAGSCTYYTDRAGNRVTVNSCTGNGPRGAAEGDDLERQQAKTVRAINSLGASIVSLEELENSARLGKDRDFAIGRLVDALNADADSGAGAGAGTWAFVPSPPPADRPTPEKEDVIRTGFIYKPAEAEPVGSSQILIDEENFDNAREPLAQAFKRPGAPDDSGFVVIVNHFKSKGSGVDDGTGQGLANPDRVGQAQALSAFANRFAAERGLTRVLLTGDFNAYSMEDPMQVLYDDGFTAVESDTEGEETYSFSGLSGSLDHVLANGPALEMVTGADIWNINSVEPIAFQYSRHNYNVTDFYRPDPYSSSDHDPEIIGLDAEDPPVPSTLAASSEGWRYGTEGLVEVQVVPTTATGPVTVSHDGTELGTAQVTAGAATVTVDGSVLEPGRHVLDVSYAGDRRTAPSTGSVVVDVRRATSTTEGTPQPARVRVRKEASRIEVVVTAPGVVPDGTVTASQDGRVHDVARLEDGRAVLVVGPFDRVGEQRIEVTYDGSALVEGSSTTVLVEAVKKKDLDADPRLASLE